MSWCKRLLLTGALAALTAVEAHAQLAGNPVELSAGGGVNNFDARDFIQDSPAYAGAMGYRWSEVLTWEASYLGTSTHRDLPGSIEHQWSYASLDARWTLRDPAGKATPYLLAGFGLGRSQDGSQPELSAGGPSLGLGLVTNLGGNPRLGLRLQVRDVMFRERNAVSFSQHIAATAGLQWSLFGRQRDVDADGVRDWLDKCPDTPAGAKVDARGCPIDSDGDGVFDGLDKCPGTPRGAKVDKQGCPIDSDGDGVPDGIDTCGDTPKGAAVDATGCPTDSDGDGVFDGLDSCATTPKGCQVDAHGCPIDTDGDGICDGLDQCPNTPAGLKVDPNGCPIEVSEKETELLDTGTIRLQNINFDVGKAVIKAESDSVIDEVAKILLQYPALTIEIGGHTDATGGKDKNLALSQARAQAVMAYLAQKFPTLDATHFTVKGYGPTAPVAPNTSLLGRAKNRRVEFKVTNTDVLRIEREKRHFVPRDAAPADSTGH